MTGVLVVADDLTGANAAAAGFARVGMRAVTVRAAARPDAVAEMVARFDAVVTTTESRHTSPGEAADRVATVVRAGWPAQLVCNRIDTTLRGNVGATTAAVLDEVRSLSGRHVVVLCAPAHPAAGRHTIGGHQLLDGRRLEDTEVARDARSPVRTSDVVELLREQADLTTAPVPLADVTATPAELMAAMREALRIENGRSIDVLVVDATTEEHLTRIARAAVQVADELDLLWVTSDPGPASAAMAEALGLGVGTGGAAAPLLVVSGSATELTRAQLARLAAERDVQLHRTPNVGSSAVPDVDATAALLDKAVSAAPPGGVVVMATALEESDLRRPTSEEAEQIPRALARAARRTLESHPVDGLFTSGGDVTAAVLAELGAHGLEVTEEVVPLAVAGSLVGGPWDGLQMVTKGGLVGDAQTTVTCVDHLRTQADLRRRLVASSEPRTPAWPPPQNRTRQPPTNNLPSERRSP